MSPSSGEAALLPAQRAIVISPSSGEAVFLQSTVPRGSSLMLAAGILYC